MQHGDKNAGSVFGLPQAGPTGTSPREGASTTTPGAFLDVAKRRPKGQWAGIAHCNATSAALWLAWESAVYYFAHPLRGVRRFAAS